MYYPFGSKKFKKQYILLLLCNSIYTANALAEQQPLNTIPKSSASNAITVIRESVNTELGKQQTMNTEMYNHTSSSENPHSVTKTQVGLGNADNTSDVDKPISTAMQTALNSKANSSAFASQAAFTAAWGWTPGGISAWSDIQALLTPGGTYVKADGTTGDPTGTITTGTGVAAAMANALDGTGGLASKAALDALPSIVFGTGLTLSEDTPSAGTDTVSITANTYQAYDADLTTAAGATGAGNSKYFGTNSGGTAGFYDLPTGGEGYTNLTAFVGQTAWRLFYSDGSGDVKELDIGASGTVLKSNGESAAPSFQADSTGTGGGTGNDISVIDCGDSATTTSITIDGGDAS